MTASGDERLREHVRSAEQASQRVLAEPPRCFAAAARDPQRPCENPKLRLTVVPTPLEAHKQRGAPCPKLETRGLLYVCGFGAPARKAATTVALIGDSHASHWRAALDVVARERGWAGVSLSHTGCPLSKATKNLPGPRRAECVEWNQQVLRWLTRHPDIETAPIHDRTTAARSKPYSSAMIDSSMNCRVLSSETALAYFLSVGLKAFVGSAPVTPIRSRMACRQELKTSQRVT